MESKELWKPVYGYEGLYEVSNYGRIKSVERTAKSPTGTRTVKERILKTQKNGSGYPGVCLCREGEQKTITIHRIVAAAFIPNTECKATVNHIDGDKDNNNVSNLEWCTYSENMKHAYGSGLLDDNPILGGLNGENSPVSKLSRIDVLMIKCLKENDFTLEDISKRFGVCAQHIGLIVKNKSWKHLTSTHLKIELK